jgi:hypothetical protein
MHGGNLKDRFQLLILAILLHFLEACGAVHANTFNSFSLERIYRPEQARHRWSVRLSECILELLHPFISQRFRRTTELCNVNGGTLHVEHERY